MKDMFNDRRSWYKDPADIKKAAEPIAEPLYEGAEGTEDIEDGEELTEDEREAQALLDADKRKAAAGGGHSAGSGYGQGGTDMLDEDMDAAEGGYVEYADGASDAESGGDVGGEAYGSYGDTDVSDAGDADGGADGEDAGKSGGDSRVLQMYLDELQAIEAISEKELAILVKKAHDGDLTARNRLVEGHLKYALSILWEYLNKGVELTELISESNVALIGAIDGFSGGDLKADINQAVRRAAERLISEDGQIQAADEDLANRVNELSDLSVEMVQELGRKPTNAELAHRLNVSEDVVESLIRMSIDAL